ncbi:glycosyltransferase family 4 protein [bacterium]|nr:glycosyltransferase family 4 protein [bacterium]
MKKKKLLVWGDMLVPTGFGNVAMNLLDTMHEDFDVYVLAINYRGDRKYDTSKYFVYPVDSQDLLGMKKLPAIIDDVKPDIIFLFQDVFHIASVIEGARQKVGSDVKIVSYFPIDGAPVSQSWTNVLDYSDAVITYSDWAINMIKDAFPPVYKKLPIHKLYHGVDRNTFFPKTKEEIKVIRNKFSWEGKFIVSNVNRFQPRKYIPGTAHAFSMFAKGYAKCNKCGHHMPLTRIRCELNLCGPEHLEHHDKGKGDVFLYLHMMSNEYVMGPGKANLLQSHLLNAGFIDSDVNSIIGINARNIYKEQPPASLVNDIYNASNVNISSAIGEGCGLSLIESASTGTPSIAPHNSAIPEMLKDTGHLIPNKAVFNMALDNGHFRPIVDTWEMAKALEVEYKKWQETGREKEINKNCIDNVKDNFMWKDKVELLKSVFKSVL